MKAKLYSLSTSHPAQAARVMLELKAIDHEIVDLLPGMHPVLLRAHGFRGATVPALKLDGQRVQGSLRISRHLERVRAQPPLFPAQAERRGRVEEAEAWGEAELQPVPRRIFRWAAARQAGLRRWLAEVSGVPLPGVGAAVNAPVARRFARVVDATDDHVRSDLAALPGMLDRVDRLIAEGTIGADDVNAADCQIASSVRALMAFEPLRPVVGHRPAADLAARLFPDYPDPVPVSLPAEWVPG